METMNTSSFSNKTNVQNARKGNKMAKLAIVNRMNKNSVVHVNMATGKAYSKEISLEMEKVFDAKQYQYKVWGTKSVFEDQGLIVNAENVHEFTLKSGATYKLYNIDQTNARKVIADYQIKQKKQSKRSTYTYDQLNDLYMKKMSDMHKLQKQTIAIFNEMTAMKSA